MNADPTKGRFYRELKSFCFEHSLEINDVANLPSNSYTYISSNNACSTSFLGYVLCSDNTNLRNHKICYGLTFFDHIPIAFDLILPCPVFSPNILPDYPKEQHVAVNWDKVRKEDIELYASLLDELALEISYDVLCCPTGSVCSDRNHIAQLDNIYSCILESISIASLSLPHRNRFNNDKKIVGWNKYCKDLYAEARYHYMLWHDGGKIRDGQLFENMKSSRALFKNALKFCKKK